MKNPLIVIKQSKTGRNELFLDVHSKKVLTRKQVVDCIKRGKYPNCHIWVINDVETPCSNPDKSKLNNFG